MFVIETKFKIRKHIKKFELQFERANVRNQRKFMNVEWNTPPNQSNMENSYFYVETCWMKFCSGTNFIQHHPTWFFSSFSKLYKFCNCANYSNISSNMAKTWCWMKCWTSLLRPYKSWWNEIASWTLLNFAENSLLYFSLKSSAHIFD